MNDHKRRQCHWLIDQLQTDDDTVGVIEILTRRLASLKYPMGSSDWSHEDWLKMVVDLELRSAEETASPEYTYTEYLDTFAPERKAENVATDSGEWIKSIKREHD